MEDSNLEKKVDDLQSTVNRLSQQIDHYFTSGQPVCFIETLRQKSPFNGKISSG